MTEIEQQFNKLYEENADSVFRLCLFKTSKREVAIDLSQDIFTKLWAYINAGNEVDNMRALLFTIARNRIKDYYKKKKTSNLSGVGIENVAEFLPGSEVTSDKAEIEEMLRLFQKLPEKDAELLQLRYIEGLAIEEIALIYNARPNTLSVRIHRLLNDLREDL